MTPADPDDRGAADPALLTAIASGDRERVLALLPQVRLIVPVTAMPGSGEAEMAVPLLVNDAGEQALPVFTGVDALREWRDDARPVPMPGSRVIAAAVGEGYDGLVVDVAGTAPFVLVRAELEALARSGC